MEVDVLGLGASLALYRERGNVTIGVNDIFSKRSTDFLVLADPPKLFSPERLKTILDSRPVAVISHRTEWASSFPSFRLIYLASGRGIISALDTKRYVFSNNSPFIAAVLAYKLGAKRINLYGVDLSGHPSLGREGMLRTSRLDYKNLYDALRERGVILKAARGSALNDILPLAR